MARATATVEIKVADLPEVAAVIKRVSDLNAQLATAIEMILDSGDFIGDDCVFDAARAALDAQRDFAAELDARDAERSFQIPPASDREV